MATYFSLWLLDFHVEKPAIINLEYRETEGMADTQVNVDNNDCKIHFILINCVWGEPKMWGFDLFLKKVICSTLLTQPICGVYCSYDINKQDLPLSCIQWQELHSRQSD